MILNCFPPFNHEVTTTKQCRLQSVCLISLLSLISTVGMKEKFSPGVKSFSCLLSIHQQTNNNCNYKESCLLWFDTWNTPNYQGPPSPTDTCSCLSCSGYTLLNTSPANKPRISLFWQTSSGSSRQVIHSHLWDRKFYYCVLSLPSFTHCSPTLRQLNPIHVNKCCWFSSWAGRSGFDSRQVQENFL
jgi:hypothetical protein